MNEVGKWAWIIIAGIVVGFFILGFIRGFFNV